MPVEPAIDLDATFLRVAECMPDPETIRLLIDARRREIARLRRLLRLTATLDRQVDDSGGDVSLAD
jgi:hypothetical protein